MWVAIGIVLVLALDLVVGSLIGRLLAHRSLAPAAPLAPGLRRAG